MRGYIDEKLLIPKIENVFLIGRERLIALEPVLDSGFNDEFCKPRKFFNDCDFKYIGNEEYILANGSVVLEEVCLRQIVIDSLPAIVKISLTDDDEALIETRLLNKKIVILNFKDYKISIED